MPSPTALYTVSEIREIEQANLAVLPESTLMQRAGHAAAKLASDLLGLPANGRILAIAGPGNNGGDAIESARLLAEAGFDVTVLLCADAAKLPPDAQQALARARLGKVRFATASLEAIQSCTDWALIIDGLFGIGLARPITGLPRDLIEAINQLACPVLALDVPTGLNADTGSIVGDGRVAVRATHTITFIADKPGLHTLFGRDCAGQVHVADLGIEDKYFKQARIQLNAVELFSACLKRRAHNTHKGSYGDVIVVGGAPGMAGAPILASRAASKCGAGRVFAAFIGEPPAYDSMQPELMCRRALDVNFSNGTIVAGPGMSTSHDAHDLLDKVIQASGPLVLDADALNLVASDTALQRKLAERKGPLLMTPHPLEAARLLQQSTQEIQSDRLAAARAIAARFDAVVVLKGSGTIIARPDGHAVINTTGNPALATAGTGDVLAGICGALLAQYSLAWEAALAATWLHGRAADLLTSQGIGPIGLTATELIPCVRTLLNQLTDQHAGRVTSH